MQQEESKASGLWEKIKNQAILKNKQVLIFGSVALTIALVLFTQHRTELSRTAALAAADAAEKLETKNHTKFGLDQRLFISESYTLVSGDALGPLLQKKGLSHEQILKIVEHSKGTFDISKFRVGKEVVFLTDKSNGAPNYFIYSPNAYEFLKIQLTEPFLVTMVKRPVTTRIAKASGVLESSLWKAMKDNNLSNAVADEMIGVLESSVDFYHQQKGDRFKLIFEEHIIDGKAVGVGDISVAMYERGDEKSYAFRFATSDEKYDYFDNEGRPARKAFLKSPVKFSRISSRFNRNRFHPVLRYRRPHLGTDYAAPRGTPIVAVAAGTVTEARRRGGNGKYVRIHHDGTYESQYLHMNGFAKGIRPGKSVQQGEVIGYVGSTGLATGPHVCFRFWKNGRQVDFLRQKLPIPEAMKEENLPKFYQVRDSLMFELEKIEYKYMDKSEAMVMPNEKLDTDA